MPLKAIVAGPPSGAQIRRPVRATFSLARATLALAWVAALPSAAGAQSTGADPSSGLIGLSLPIGARAIGQGRTAAATSGELQALAYNPAVLSGVGRGAVTFSRFEAASAADLSGSFVAGGARTRWGSLAVQAIVIDYGDIPVTDTSPEPIGTIEVGDWAVGLSYANRTYHDRLAYGVTAKWLSTRFGPIDAGGPAFDAGLVIVPRAGLPLSLGVALRNLGPDVDFGERPDGSSGEQPLPSRVRFGIQFHPASFPGLSENARVELGFDIEADARDPATSSQHAGAALTLVDAVVVRGGFLLLDDPFGADGRGSRSAGGSVGVGVRFGGFEADVAREISVSELGDETHFSVGWRF